MPTDYDIFIIGGGVNACGIARDAAGRGFKVGLAEMNDFASGTSSKATKLIHGGFRYLEYYELRLVREALSEREVLLNMAPHIVRPLRFVLPHHEGMRPAWLLRLGLFIYDHIGKRKLLPATKHVDLRRSELGKPLKPVFSLGFEYSDCWVDDARLVVLNARDAENRGAELYPRTRVAQARRMDGAWHIDLEDQRTGDCKQVSARLVVNAAGPWVDELLGNVLGGNSAKNVRLVKGSHIVVSKLHDHDRAYIFQNADGRIIFIIPYEGEFSLIGTTDQDYAGDPGNVEITAEEIGYLCEAASEYLKNPVRESDVVWTYSGVRPLYDDGASAAQEATRDYVLRIDIGDGQAPLINIFGGKITTYRKLSEAVLNKIEEAIGKRSEPWTAKSHLPGGNFPVTQFEARVEKLQAEFPFLSADHACRLVRSYGTEAWAILQGASVPDDLGTDFGATLTEREVEYLIEREWALGADDVLWRRSKLGLKMTRAQREELADWMRARVGEQSHRTKQDAKFNPAHQA